MRPDTFQDLPEELRPLAVRKRSMRLIGRWMVFVGGLLLVGALVVVVVTSLETLPATGVTTSVVPTSIIGSLIFVKGLITLVVTDAM